MFSLFVSNLSALFHVLFFPFTLCCIDYTDSLLTVFHLLRVFPLLPPIMLCGMWWSPPPKIFSLLLVIFFRDFNSNFVIEVGLSNANDGIIFFDEFFHFFWKFRVPYHSYIILLLPHSLLFEVRGLR